MACPYSNIEIAHSNRTKELLCVKQNAFPSQLALFNITCLFLFYQQFHFIFPYPAY